jgi:hypothetical protein
MKKLFLLLILIFFFLPNPPVFAADYSSAWDNFADNVDNAFYFVADKIIDLMDFFKGQAYTIGKLVLLIAILSAGLNYALTGQGLKENFVKILKATLFFLIVTAAYPRIIGFITSWTFSMAEQSVGNSVKQHFDSTTKEIVTQHTITVSTGTNTALDEFWNTPVQHTAPVYRTMTADIIRQINVDNRGLFSDLTVRRKSGEISYTAFAPAAVIRIVFFIANECIGYADGKTTVNLWYMP